jgi:hypothetical protein
MALSAIRGGAMLGGAYSSLLLLTHHFMFPAMDEYEMKYDELLKT